MSFDYTILWFENNKTYAKNLRSEIEEYLLDLGYKPNLIIRPDDSDLDSILEEEDVDLILMDQNLRSSTKGDTLIKKIRKNELYTEAILYSQDMNYRKEIESQLDGVFFEFRKDLLGKVQKIILLTLNKNMQIENIRGLFIAETIFTTRKIEEIVTEILQVNGQTLEFFNFQIMQTGFLTDESKYEFIQRYLKFWLSIVNKRCQDPAVKNKEPWETLKDEIVETQTKTKNYQKIIRLRNELAHSKKCDEKKNTLLVKGDHGNLKEKCYTQDKCKEIREMFFESAQSLNDCLKMIKKLNSTKI